MTLPAHATTLIRANAAPCADTVVLSYDERFLRRKRLQTVSGLGVMVDLAETTSLAQGDALVLEDGRLIGVIAAPEPILLVRGDLARLAWHIGNRHTPCQICPDHLLIRQDHVLEAMLLQLGAKVSRSIEPFTPEGGAYGHGRTFGHDHGGYDHGVAEPAGFQLPANLWKGNP